VVTVDYHTILTGKGDRPLLRSTQLVELLPMHTSHRGTMAAVGITHWANNCSYNASLGCGQHGPDIGRLRPASRTGGQQLLIISSLTDSPLSSHSWSRIDPSGCSEPVLIWPGAGNSRYSDVTVTHLLQQHSWEARVGGLHSCPEHT
jgi:hypothetical protein